MIRRYNYRVALGEATFELLPTGDGTGYAILRMEASETTTLSIRGGDAKFYTDNSGAGESSTWTITSGAIRSIFVKCTSRSLLVFPKQGVITKWGISTSLNGWSSKINAPLISSVGFPLRNLTHLHLTGQCEFSGSLPSGLTYLYLLSSNINWTYSGSLPSGLTYLYLNGTNINWTAFDASGSGNITTYYRLLDFVTTAFSVTNFISLLQSMVSRVGGLPTTCIISDYDNNPTPDEIKNATPNQSGTDAEKAKHWVEQLRSVKGVTSLILNNTDIS